MSTTEVATVNNIANSPTPVPGLIQDDSSVCYCNANNLPEKYDVGLDGQPIYHCPHLIQLKVDEVYEFVLTNNVTSTSVDHPIHLHGYTFEVLDMGTYAQLMNGTTAFVDAEYPPVLKDTVCIPKQGFVKIRLRTTNPGYWTFHCHIDDHFS